MTSDIRNCQILVRVTEAEKENIEAAAQECGRSTSGYVRDRISGQSMQRRPVTAAAAELLAICHILERIAPASAEEIKAKAKRVIAILCESGELDR